MSAYSTTNDYLSSYRFSLGANYSSSNESNATVTSNLNPPEKPTSASDSSVSYTTQPTSTTTSSATMHSFPKHWVWSRNLFYPNIANSSSYLSYLNGNSSIMTTNLSDQQINTKTESLNSNSPAQITEINSDDDSTDNQDVESEVRS